MSALDLYGNLRLDGLADLVGDFDARTSTGTEDWIRNQWNRYAKALGFRDDLDRLVRGRARSRVIMNDAGLRAFYAFLSRRGSSTTNADEARVRHQCIVALPRIDPANLWLTNVESRRLPGGGCYDTGESAPHPDSLDEILGVIGPAVQPRLPVFTPANRLNYFYDHKGIPAAVECFYTLRLSLGTFPLVFGDNLSEPVGLQWMRHKKWNPAYEAMRICSHFWTQLGNLRQDARQVIQQYEHFRLHTARVLNRKMPGARDARTGLLKPLNKRQRTVGPRGPIDVNAYNLALLAFSAFFAARRAYLRAPAAFTPETWAAARANPDPVLREQLGLKRAV